MIQNRSKVDPKSIKHCSKIDTKSIKNEFEGQTAKRCQHRTPQHAQNASLLGAKLRPSCDQNPLGDCLNFRHRFGSKLEASWTRFRLRFWRGFVVRHGFKIEAQAKKTDVYETLLLKIRNDDFCHNLRNKKR